MDLTAIQPHVVSKDLRGYTVLMYGEPKSGKTTTATKFPKHLILGFEKGWNAIPGAMALPINSWSEFKKALKELKKPEVKERYETIIIDTADIAFDYCEKYICNIHGKETISDFAFGKGYTLVGKEFDECVRSIIQQNYGLVLISHSTDKTFTNELGQEYNQIVPTLPNKARLICLRTCDIIGYSRSVMTNEGLRTKFFMRGTPQFIAGSRFRYTPDSIDFSYKNLVDAVSSAIDKQMAEDGEDLFTSERSNLNSAPVAIDFDEVMGKFNNMVKIFMEKDPAYYGPRITEIIERHLGKGNKVGDCTRDQAEIVDLIVYDLKELN